MYKLIACDLDETLLSTDNTVSEKNRAAIKKADELGVKIIIATGRGIVNVANTIDAIGFTEKEDEYVISFNGGAVTETKDTKFLYTDGITYDFASELYKRGLNYDVCVQIFTKKDIFVYNYTDEERANLEPEIQVTEIFEDNIDFLKETEIIKVIFMNSDRHYLEKIEKDFKDILMDSDVSYSSNRYLEFNNKGVNKGAALQFIADRLGIAMSETMAIGDNYNDWSMFKVAGLSVGVQNMVEELKGEVDYITKANNDEDAVAEIIEKFILNPKK